MEPIKVICPHCGSHECFTEVEQIPDGTVVDSSMCLECGYTTSTLNIEGSAMVQRIEEGTAELIKDLRWVDPKTNLVWYPVVLNFPSYGIIFPDGTSKESWGWRAAPAVEIPEEDKQKYPVPGQPGEFYARRVDMSQGQMFASESFYTACKFLGFIQ